MRQLFWILFALLTLVPVMSASADETKTPTASTVQYDGSPIRLMCPSTVKKGKGMCDPALMKEALASAYSEGIPLQLQEDAAFTLNIDYSKKGGNIYFVDSSGQTIRSFGMWRKPQEKTEKLVGRLLKSFWEDMVSKSNPTECRHWIEGVEVQSLKNTPEILLALGANGFCVDSYSLTSITITKIKTDEKNVCARFEAENAKKAIKIEITECKDEGMSDYGWYKNSFRYLGGHLDSAFNK